MPQIRLPVIDGPQGDAYVFRRSEGSDDPTAPFLIGLGRIKGDIDWLCGVCSLLLAESINPQAIPGVLVFVCPTCGASNEGQGTGRAN
ncbi:MAG: hypothetical protein ACLQMH_03730 [Solirubrobacteraceae bacterium]